MPLPLDEKLRRGAGAAGLLGAALGAIALGGRASGVDLFRGTGVWATDLTGGLCLLLGGTALWFLHRARFPRAGLGCALAMLALAGTSMLRFAMARAAVPLPPFPYGTSILALLALALVFLTRPRGPAQHPVSVWLAGAVVSLSGAALFTALFPSPVGGTWHHPLGLPASVATLLVGIGTLSARPDDKFIRLFFSSTAAGLLARRLFFGAVLVPAVLSRLFILLVLNDVVRLNDGILLLASVTILCGFVITLRSAETAASTDSTEQESTQQRLRSLNERLELATRAAALGVWEWDQVVQKFFWDPRMMQIHGTDPLKFGGTFEEWARDLHPEDRERILANFQRVIGEGTLIEESFRIISPADGRVRYVEARGIAQRDRAGRLLRITGTCRDTTTDREASQELAALNERFKLALRSSNYGVWELDIATRRIAWDDRMFEIYGVPRSEEDGQRDVWQRCLHPDDREEASDLSLKVIAGNVPRYDTKFRIIRPDGQTRHIEAHGYLQRDSKGQPLRFVGLNRDVTAETQMIEALRTAEERWQLAIEGTNDAVWDWDIQNGAVFHDERWSRMLGSEPKESDATLESWRQMIHPDDIAGNAAALEDHFAERTPFYRRELRVRTKSGEWKWILDRGKVVARSADGRPLRMAGTHTDITERKRLEQRLQQMEELASQVSRLAQIGGWELALDDGQLTLSSVVYQVFEMEANAAPALPGLLNFFPAEARATLQTALQAARSNAAPFDLELPAVSAHGREIWVRVLGKPDSVSRPVSIQGAIQDITARHESDEARRQLESQLFQAQKMETLGTLAGGIAHDFNNLLTGIIGYHELAADSLEPGHSAHAYLGEARNASLRARDLVEQILTFGRAQSGEVKHASVDLAVVIDEARRFLRATIPATINIEVQVAPDCFRVLADATKIHQVILNLGSNAAHAMRSRGGSIKIAVVPVEVTRERSPELGSIAPGNYVCLSVSDSGHGMDAATLRRIFDPFFTTKNNREGTGLGLAVVHGIVRAHRGTIEVESKPGVGSTFHVYLPAAEEIRPIVEANPAATRQGTGQFICIVDDEEIVGSCTKLALEVKGYRAKLYASAEECLTAVQQQRTPFDLLLTDQTMPRMQGVELAAAIRKFYPQLPVVIMSGYFSKIPSEALSELGRVELLAKPFTTDELAQTIDRVLQPVMPNR